jgi:hypothetical protein
VMVARRDHAELDVVNGQRLLGHLQKLDDFGSDPSPISSY